MKRLVFAALALLVSGVAFGLTRTKTDEIVASDGGPVAFPAGITVPTSNGEFLYSTYSATVTAGTNVQSATSPATLKFHRFGNYLHVFGQVTIDPTSGSATLTTFTLSIPVTRSSNFSGTSGAAGFAGLPTTVTNGVCSATNAAKTVSCTYGAGGTSAESVNVDFWYTVSGD